MYISGKNVNSTHRRQFFPHADSTIDRLNTHRSMGDLGRKVTGNMGYEFMYKQRYAHELRHAIIKYTAGSGVTVYLVHMSIIQELYKLYALIYSVCTEH